jgi:hypothetical protein
MSGLANDVNTACPLEVLGKIFAKLTPLALS